MEKEKNLMLLTFASKDNMVLALKHLRATGELLLSTGDAKDDVTLLPSTFISLGNFVLDNVKTLEEALN